MIPILLNISQDYNNNEFLHNEDSQIFRNDIIKKVYDSYLPKSTLNSWKDKNADKIYTYSFVEREDIIDKWIELNIKFNSSFEQKEHLFQNVSSSLIKNDFRKSLENILSFSPEIISVGVSDDECVYIYFEKNNKSVYFDLFFEPEQKTEVSLTIFENKESKVSYVDYLDNSIINLKNELFVENELSYLSFAEI